MEFKKPDESDNPLSEAENRIYEDAVKRLRREIAQGRTFDEACASLAGIDQSLKDVIIDDFLKIIIAEDHFGSGKDLDDIALLLGLTLEQVETARDEMIEEVGNEMAAQYRDAISKMTH